MKRIILMVIAMVMTVGIAQVEAAPKKEKVTVESVTFLTDIDCDHCVQKVMNYMPYQKGVKDVKVDLPKKLITVSYKVSKTTEAALVKDFANISVKAKKYEEPKAPAAKAQR